MITGNKALLSTKEENPDELDIVWKGILYEYSSLIRNDRSEAIFDVWHKIQFTHCKMELVNCCVKALKYQYSETIAAVIHELGYRLIVNKEDREEYLKQVYAVETESRNLVIMINQYAVEYELLCPEDKDNKKVKSLLDYEQELKTLSRFMGYRVVKETETVYEICSIINNYIQYHKRNSKNGTTV